MGAGYTPLTQFSNGDYVGATQTQDDFAVIAQNGPTLLSDDYGDGRASAYGLGAGDVTVEGLVTSRTDLDVFAVTRSCSGTLSATLTPAALGPDLDTGCGCWTHPARSSPVGPGDGSRRHLVAAADRHGRGRRAVGRAGYLLPRGRRHRPRRSHSRLQRLRLGRPLLALRHRLPGLGPHRDGAEPPVVVAVERDGRRTGSASSGTPPPTTVARRSPRTS